MSNCEFNNCTQKLWVDSACFTFWSWLIQSWSLDPLQCASSKARIALIRASSSLRSVFPPHEKDIPTFAHGYIACHLRSWTWQLMEQPCTCLGRDVSPNFSNLHHAARKLKDFTFSMWAAGIPKSISSSSVSANTAWPWWSSSSPSPPEPGQEKSC